MAETPKRESGMQRVVGFKPEIEKAVFNFFDDLVRKDGDNKIERNLDPELVDTISALNKFMKDFLESYGVQSLEIPINSISIIDKSKLNSEQLDYLKKYHLNTAAMFIPEHQRIYMITDYIKDNKLKFMSSLVHEMLHFNSFQSAQKVSSSEGIGLKLKYDSGEEEKISVGIRRMGFNVRSKDPNTSFYFRDLDEAIITELQIRFGDKYFQDLSNVKEEIEEKQKAINGISQNTGEEIEELKHRLMTIQTRKKEDGTWESRAETYGHEKEREKFNKLIDDLYQKNEGEFQSREEVFNLFARASLNGHLLPVARLIEKTYGKGSFRKIGEETKDKKI